MRLSARICQRSSKWCRDSLCSGRAVGRCYGTVASGTERRERRASTVSDDATYPTQRPWSGSFTTEPSKVARAQVAPRFSVPSVLLPQEAARSPSVHKIHILGEDERSKFIAHALSGVYDSVEMLGWSKRSNKYRNIQRTRSRSKDEPPEVEPIAVAPRVLGNKEDSHIDQLVVTGRGFEAVKALETVKHRVDDQTTICLMNDGLGVLEDVRKRIFNGKTPTPNFLLGHMSHRLAFNRTYDSVRQIRPGTMKMMAPEDVNWRTTDVKKSETRSHFIETMREVDEFKSRMAPMDEWMRFKLPSIVFDSVVEPVCVLLEIPYKGLLQNPAAKRLMYRLLDEIAYVLEELPEVRGSTIIRNYLNNGRIEKIMYQMIIGKQSQQSQLALRIQHGMPTDINYLNGYFIRRARAVGIDVEMNVSMRDMIMAKHSQAIERRNSFIPLEETSIEPGSSFKYRTSPTVDSMEIDMPM